LSKSENLIAQATTAIERYEYDYAKNETEIIMWAFTDNYLEMAKGRLYAEDENLQEATKFTLSRVFLIILKLFAPFLPHVTERIYLSLFSEEEGYPSIHRSPWPQGNPANFDLRYLELGDVLIGIASAVRRYKSEKGLSLGTKLEILQLKTADKDQQALLIEAIPDLQSITRAEAIEFVDVLDGDLESVILEDFNVEIGLCLAE
jgi:valyl-tRNA synthetase